MFCPCLFIFVFFWCCLPYRRCFCLHLFWVSCRCCLRAVLNGLHDWMFLMDSGMEFQTLVFLSVVWSICGVLALRFWMVWLGCSGGLVGSTLSGIRGCG